MTRAITVFVVFQICIVQQVYGREINTATVQYDNGVYTLTFEAELAAPQADVFRLVTDHNRLYRLNDMIDTSTLLTRPGVIPAKRKIKMHICILFFCRHVTVVETVTEYNMDTILAVVVPSESDFVSGETRWTIIPLDKQTTQFSLTSRLRPGFWIPPVIGPWLIKKKMIRELSIMVDRMEQLTG